MTMSVLKASAIDYSRVKVEDGRDQMDADARAL
jgi:hypothetical protein